MRIVWCTVNLCIGETYLGGGSSCPSLYTPVNIEVVLYKLDKTGVRKLYFSFDQKIIEFSFNTMESSRIRFYIFFPTTQIYGATAQLKIKCTITLPLVLE